MGYNQRMGSSINFNLSGHFLFSVFLIHGQIDFSKASNSISHRLTLIFPKKKDENAQKSTEMPQFTKNHKMCQKITENAENGQSAQNGQKWKIFEGFSVTCVGLAA